VDVVENTPETAFVNHAWSDSKWEPLIGALYRSEQCAIHFDDYPISFDSAEWEDQHGEDETYHNRFGRLEKYLNEGRIIAASYTGHPDLRGGRFVGAIGPASGLSDQPETTAELLVCRTGSELSIEDAIVDQAEVPVGASQDELRSRFDELNEEARTYVELVLDNEGAPEDSHENYRILKGFQFDEDDVGWAWNPDFPGLWAANKRGTIKGWVAGSDHVHAAYYHLVEDEQDMLRVDDVYDIIDVENHSVWALSSGQLEALCAEYLRRTNRDFVELISAGGSLSEADIYGQSNEGTNDIIAQVTFNPRTSEVRGKLESLLAYGNGRSKVKLRFFGPEEHLSALPEQINETALESVYVPIETVYDEFADGLGPEYLTKMLTIDSDEARPNL
jgi:hypothetical protein